MRYIFTRWEHVPFKHLHGCHHLVLGPPTPSQDKITGTESTSPFLYCTEQQTRNLTLPTVLFHGEELFAKLFRRKSTVETQSDAEPRYSCISDVISECWKLRWGIYYMQAFTYSQTQLMLQKQKKTTENRKRWWGRETEKQVRRRNKRKDVFR